MAIPTPWDRSLPVRTRSSVNPMRAPILPSMRDSATAPVFWLTTCAIAAIRKLTWMQAQIFGLADRGLLRSGMAADVVVFDPVTVAPEEAELVHDLPGGAARLVQQAAGIHLVLVNGEPILERGTLTGARAGQVLRGGSGKI